MASEFKCEYKMNAPMTGCKAAITVKKPGEDAPVLEYDFKETSTGYQKQGSLTVSDSIVKDVRDLVNRHLVSLKTNMVPGMVTDTSDESFKVTIDGRCHIYKKESIAKMTNDDTVEDAWKLLMKYLPPEVKEGSKLIFD